MATKRTAEFLSSNGVPVQRVKRDVERAKWRLRIEILRQTEDGFLIAEKDLELRGGGDPLGLAQSGLPTYRFADPAAHRDLIAAAADDARLALIRDPELTSPRGEALRCLSELFDWRADDHLGGAG